MIYLVRALLYLLDEKESDTYYAMIYEKDSECGKYIKSWLDSGSQPLGIISGGSWVTFMKIRDKLEKFVIIDNCNPRPSIYFKPTTEVLDFFRSHDIVRTEDALLQKLDNTVWWKEFYKELGSLDSNDSIPEIYMAEYSDMYPSLYTLVFDLLRLGIMDEVISSDRKAYNDLTKNIAKIYEIGSDLEWRSLCKQLKEVQEKLSTIVLYF